MIRSLLFFLSAVVLQAQPLSYCVKLGVPPNSSAVERVEARFTYTEWLLPSRNN